ncbi:YgzB family protein, partial [Siminovitchia fortis]|uniref:YgzB family protein n=1 Tax=Siminovitchia fortis TaxID=254758 RepID=UPI0021B30269
MGLIMMYIGILFEKDGIVMRLFMILGLLGIMGRRVVYFWMGMVCRKGVEVEWGKWGKGRKIVGGVDMWMEWGERV